MEVGLARSSLPQRDELLQRVRVVLKNIRRQAAAFREEEALEKLVVGAQLPRVAPAALPPRHAFAQPALKRADARRADLRSGLFWGREVTHGSPTGLRGEGAQP